MIYFLGLCREVRLLTVEEVAEHFRLKPDTERRRIKSGDLRAVRIQRTYRIEWSDVLACAQSPTLRCDRIPRYEVPLLTKRHLARGLNVGIRTVERWLAEGLPTRSVFGTVRMNRFDVEDWLEATRGVTLPRDW